MGKNKVGAAAKDYILIIIAIFSAAFGIKGYLLSSHFIDGGVTGISMLVNNIFGFPLYILIPLINLPFVVLGYFQMGLPFAIKSTIAILGLALCLAWVDFPDITPDKLLTAVFGGFFIGVGIGLAIRGGAVLDGTEIAALLVSKKSSSLKVSDVILLMNVVIFATAAFSLGIEPASYSILTYLAASKTIDFLLNGVEEYTGVTIISTESGKVQDAITSKLGRGITVYQGKGGHGRRGDSSKASEILFTVVTRLELGSLNTLIKSIDPEAFIIQHSINDVHGGIVKKRALH
ncbi:MAG TPA: YitT family protein [Flavisolibacter sp.]